MDLLEFHIILTGTTRQGLTDALVYCVESDGQASMIDCEGFGPFDTVTDIVLWAVRQIARRQPHLVR